MYATPRTLPGRLSQRPMPLLEAGIGKVPRPVEDLDDLYDRAPCGFISVGSDCVVLEANANFAAWLGMSVGQIVGRRFEDLLSLPDAGTSRLTGNRKPHCRTSSTG
jgi:PAS domain-containing protein